MSKSNITNGETNRQPSAKDMKDLYKNYINELKQFTRKSRMNMGTSPDETTHLNFSVTQYSRNKQNSLKNDLIRQIV